MFYWLFFFKQKTADELRISDWSSDVCSSDLADAAGQLQLDAAGAGLLRVLHREEAPPCGRAVDLWILPVDVEHVGVAAHPADAALDAQLGVAHGVGRAGRPGRVLGEVAGVRRAVGAAAAVAFGHGRVAMVVGAE